RRAPPGHRARRRAPRPAARTRRGARRRARCPGGARRHPRARGPPAPRRAGRRRDERPARAAFAGHSAALGGGMSVTAARAGRLRLLYARLPEAVRHCLRPLNLTDELASVLPATARAALLGATDGARRL